MYTAKPSFSSTFGLFTFIFCLLVVKKGVLERKKSNESTKGHLIIYLMQAQEKKKKC